MKERVIFEDRGEAVLLEDAMYVGRKEGGVNARDNVRMKKKKQTKTERGYLRLCKPCNKI